MVETTDEWIIERTGIKERRIIGKDESVATMGAAAARKALEAANVDKNSVDMSICATTSASRALPSAACEIQRELGIPAIPAFDIAAACAGFCYALSIADQYIKTGLAKRILVIGSDCLSQLISPEDRSMVILFGDAAGAVLLEASEQPGILSTHIHADGKYSELLYVDNPIRGDEASVHNSWGSMKGNDVFKVACAVDDVSRGGVERGDLAQNQPLVGHRLRHRHRRAQRPHGGCGGSVDTLHQLNIVFLDEVHRQIALIS